MEHKDQNCKTKTLIVLSNKESMQRETLWIGLRGRGVNKRNCKDKIKTSFKRTKLCKNRREYTLIGFRLEFNRALLV